jgi:class 3 adenylate cyclase
MTVDDGAAIARGRILHAGSSFTTVETLIEDGMGRSVAHVTGSAVSEVLDPPAPPWPGPPDGPGPDPAYATPDPSQRSLPPSLDPAVPPAAALVGMEVVDVSDTRAVATMRTSGWFCNAGHDVEPGIVACLVNYTAALLTSRLAGPGRRGVTFETSMSLLTAVPADGRALRATASLAEQSGDLFIVDARIEDEDGRAVMLGRGTLGKQARRGSPQGRPANRVLLTVLFTDLVGSTERAGNDGDAKWRAVLEEHHAIVRRQIQLHGGREVKTTGDGFLVTFDSPSRAVQCAQGIREGVSSLGLEVRSGVHTGECELIGTDVAGLAVHIASRVQSAAAPGEILVSHTVRDLVVGSGLDLVDRGIHELKGLAGTWPLFAVAG